MSPELLALLDAVAGCINKYIPSPYAGEMKGIADYIGLNLGEVVFLNLLYELSAHQHIM